MDSSGNRPTRLLFVCSGNLFRSPVAAGFARRVGGERVEVKSCGTIADEGCLAVETAIRLMAERGIDISSHRSQPVAEELLKWADWIICMEQNHVRFVQEVFPDFAHKTRLLRKEGIPDPICADGKFQKMVIEMIEAGIEELIQSEIEEPVVRGKGLADKYRISD